MSERPIRVALFFDQETWILASIARALKHYLEPSGRFVIDPLKAPRFRHEIAPLCSRYDVIHYLSPGDFYRLGSATPVPSVVTVHHVATRVVTRFNALAREVDVICPINSECRDQVSQLDGVAGIPMHLTPFGIDTEFFSPRAGGRERLLQWIGCPADSILLGLAAKKNSNEDERKGFDRTWKVLELLREKFGDRVRLVLFGPTAEEKYGWQQSDIPEPIRHLVHLTGFVSNEDMPVLISGLDFYLCLSRIEGGPYPVMESLGCGVRVISTDVGIVRELIDDGVTGFLVDGDDYLERIPTILEQWPLDSPASRAMAEAGRNRVIERRCWSRVATPVLYQRIYGDAMRRYSERPGASRMAKSFRLISARFFALVPLPRRDRTSCQPN